MSKEARSQGHILPGCVTSSQSVSLSRSQFPSVNGGGEPWP